MALERWADDGLGFFALFVMSVPRSSDRWHGNHDKLVRSASCYGLEGLLVAFARCQRVGSNVEDKNKRGHLNTKEIPT